MVKLLPDYSALDRPAIVTYDLWRRRLGTWARERSQELSHNSRLHALYVYKRHSNAKYLIKMSELEEEVLLDLEFEVDEHSSTTVVLVVIVMMMMMGM